MSRRVTIKDVAAHAKVSYQTVSKVLNKQAQVSKDTEERIWEAVRVLGYRPNVIARSLRSQHSKMLGYSWAPSPSDQVELDPGSIPAKPGAGRRCSRLPGTGFSALA